MPTDPWYSAGLQFTCTQCGDCCTAPPGDGIVLVSDAEIWDIVGYLGAFDFEEMRDAISYRHTLGQSLRQRPNGDCILFSREKRQCTVHSVKPAQCRSYPFWPANLDSAKSWAEVCDVCPGAGQGELIPASEISLRAKEVPAYLVGANSEK